MVKSVSVEKRVIGGRNVDDAEAPVLDGPLSHGTRRFGNHRSLIEGIEKGKGERVSVKGFGFGNFEL